MVDRSRALLEFPPHSDMDTWRKPTTVSYKRWKNPERSVEGFAGQKDEDQCTDNEIYTVGVNFGTRIDQRSPEITKTQDAITVDDALDAIGFGKFHWKLSFLTGLSWIADSMEMMILSIIGPQLHCEWKLPAYQVALITSVVFLGMGISAPLWGQVLDKYGRKYGLRLSMCWILYYGLLTSFSPVYGWLLFLRGLVGFGIGGTPQSMTLYSEFLPVKARGLSLMLLQVFWSVGAVLEVILALWIMPTLNWRWLLGISTLPTAIFICFSFWLPESPRFDLLRGKTDKALETLRRIAKENGKTLPQLRLITQKQDTRGRIASLFNVQYRKTTLLLLYIWFVNAFSYYGIILLTTEVFQTGSMCATVITGAKIEPNCSLQCKYLTPADYRDLLWVTFAEFPGILISIIAVNYIGRKKAMALSFFMFALFMLPLYACMGRVGVTIIIFIARAFISGGFQAAFVYTSEVFPTDVRGVGMGICTAMSRIGALITPFVAQVLLRTSLYFTLSVYCGSCILAGAVCFILSTETLGRGLQESSTLQETREQVMSQPPFQQSKPDERQTNNTSPISMTK